MIEGFDQLSTFEEQYNYDYYQRLIENRGYVKEVDWVERKLYMPKEVDERIPTLSKKMMEKYGLRFGEAKNTGDFLKKYADGFFEIIDETYKDIYQSVPFTDKMKKQLIESFKLIINVKHVYVILDKNDKIVCFGLCFPSIAKAVQKSGGRFTLGCIIRCLKAIENPKVLDLALIGVLPEYRRKGIATAMINKLLERLAEGEVEYAETNLNLEDNVSIQNQWKIFDSVLHKRRRSYIKTL